MSHAIAGIKIPSLRSSSRSGSYGDRKISSTANLSFTSNSKNKPLSRKIFAGDFSHGTDSMSTAVAAGGEVLVPGGRFDDSSTAIESAGNKEATFNDQPVLQDAGLPVEDEAKVDVATTSISAESMSIGIWKEGDGQSGKVNNGLQRVEEKQGFIPPPVEDEAKVDAGLPVEDEAKVDVTMASISVESMNIGSRKEGDGQSGKVKEMVEEKQRFIPPPGTGQRIYEIDPLLKAHRTHLDYRYSQYRKLRDMIEKYEGGLDAFSRGYEKFGFTRSANGIAYREWAPGAKSASLIGDFNNWNPNADVMTKGEFGVWEIFLPNNADGSPPIPHGSRVKIRMDTPSGIKDSIPAWIKFSVQAPGEIPYNGIYYDPPEEERYVFEHPQPSAPKSLRIYEAHVGMSSTEPKINTYASFRDDVLPRVKKLGYNAVQIMAIQEHSYYASFGYHVTNFFAPSSRFGTPDELKSLIDRAHELGLLVLMDIVHR